LRRNARPSSCAICGRDAALTAARHHVQPFLFLPLRCDGRAWPSPASAPSTASNIAIWKSATGKVGKCARARRTWAAFSLPWRPYLPANKDGAISNGRWRSTRRLRPQRPRQLLCKPGRNASLRRPACSSPRHRQIRCRWRSLRLPFRLPRLHRKTGNLRATLRGQSHRPSFASLTAKRDRCGVFHKSISKYPPSLGTITKAV